MKWMERVGHANRAEENTYKAAGWQARAQEAAAVDAVQKRIDDFHERYKTANVIKVGWLLVAWLAGWLVGWLK